jgi:dihydrolipoamide dehydrogenase
VVTDGRRVLSYRDAIVQEHRPGSVVIVGGGALGVEFATLWNAYGTHVTLVEALPRLVPLEDEEVSAELAKQLRRAGVEVRTGTPLENIETTSDAAKVRLAGAAAAPSTLEADQVLVATGFTPNSQDLGLGEIGVEIDPRGFVQIDDHLRTSVPGVWAIGDVTGKLLLAHVASAQGIACAEVIAGHPRAPLDYHAMPRATYCRPQIASVGFTEAQARGQGRSVRTARFSFSANGKALGVGEPIGWVKIVADAASGVLLGAHLIGPEVTELLPELTLACRLELPAEAVAHNVHAHPTLSEVVMEAAHGLVGGYIHA